MTEDECYQQAVDVGDTCSDENGQWTLMKGGDSYLGDDGMDSGIPGWFGLVFVMVIVIGIGVTIWKVSTARSLARDAGMDPDVATGMTLLDDNGLSATYLASSLRTPRTAEPSATAVPPSAADRLGELKRLLDGGLVTQAEYDERRKAIIDSV